MITPGPWENHGAFVISAEGQIICVSPDNVEGLWESLTPDKDVENFEAIALVPEMIEFIREIADERWDSHKARALLARIEGKDNG